MLLLFTKASFHEIKKVTKLLNALDNQVKNLIESRLKTKNISTAERTFLEDMKKNEEQSIGFKDPKAKYYNVVLANFFYFFVVSECMKFDAPNDSSYDPKQIELF